MGPGKEKTSIIDSLCDIRIRFGRYWGFYECTKKWTTLRHTAYISVDGVLDMYQLNNYNSQIQRDLIELKTEIVLMTPLKN